MSVRIVTNANAHSNAHSNVHTPFEYAFAFAFECECKTFAVAFGCHFKTFDGSNVLTNAFQMLGYMNIVARRDGWVRALEGARASVRGPTTGFVEVVQV